MNVELRQVSKSFGAVRAVADLDFEIVDGALTSLLGPSGCGKTTTLRMIAGFERPDLGEILIGGRVVAGQSDFVAPQDRHVGVVFQQLALFPHLDVAGNVGYGLRGGRRSARAARVEELLEMVGLAGLGGRLPHELSGGQAQRVALARALAPRPALVLLDEPFSSLDVTLRYGLRAEVRRILRDAGVTALLVTHDQGEALSTGDRVAVMFDGRLAQVGTPEEVYRNPASDAVGGFLGDANRLAGTARGGVLESAAGPLRVGVPDGPATALVRPEDIDLEADPTADATVEAVDYFGHDQLVAVRLLSGEAVAARLHARRRFEPGAPVRVCLPEGPVTAFTDAAPG